MNKIPQISIVVPLFNERHALPHLVNRLNELMDTVPLSIEVILVDDGSGDETPIQIKQLAFSNPKYTAVLLARNYGHQIAITAGLQAANGTDAVMIIDGDLQDSPEMISEFYARYQEGYDVVYGIRKRRKENLLKKAGYFIFYRLLNRIAHIDIPLDSGDFSLLSRRVVDVLNKMPEESRYIRGMRTWVGFRQTGIEYKREGRIAGQSKYSVKMLFKLAYNGIFNFSEFPIKFITGTGVAAILIAIAYLSYTLIKKYIYGTVPEGFTGLLFAIILFSGVQLLSLGIIGQYVLRIFFQVKGRPLYLVKEEIRNKELINE